MRHKIISSIVAIAVILGVSVQVTAETTDENAFKYRQNIMTALRGHTGAIAMQARGLAGDPSQVAKHARAMADLSSELHLVFQEGSNTEDSEALTAIWEQPEAFAAAIQATIDATAELQEAADSGDMKAVAGAFRNVGKSCKGCHDDFRVAH